MKTKALKLLAVLSLFVICSCNKGDNCNTTYTVSGTLLDGKTGLPIADSGTKLLITQNPDYNNHASAASASAYPDKNGKFSMTYSNCDNNSNPLGIVLLCPHKNYFLFDPYFDTIDPKIPKQENIIRTWTAALNGWLVLYLQPLTALLPGDTLYIEFPQGDSTRHFTFTTTKSGILDSSYSFAGFFPLVYKRGKNAKQNIHTIINLGDPYLSRYTINY